MGIGTRLDALIRAKGTRPGTLAREAGVSKNTVYSIIKRNNDKVDPDILARLARVLGVPLSALYGQEEPLIAHPDILPVVTCSVPMLGSIACGEPIYAEPVVCCQTEGGEPPFDFALRCKGDSMIDARIFDGDIVFIRRQDYVDDGTIAAVLIDDEATLKRVYRLADGRIELRAANARYAPILIGGENETRSVRILGKAVAFQGQII